MLVCPVTVNIILSSAAAHISLSAVSNSSILIAATFFVLTLVALYTLANWPLPTLLPRCQFLEQSEMSFDWYRSASHAGSLTSNMASGESLGPAGPTCIRPPPRGRWGYRYRPPRAVENLSAWTRAELATVLVL